MPGAGDLRKLEGRIVQGFRKLVKAEWYDFPMTAGPVQINPPPLNWSMSGHDDLEANKTCVAHVYGCR